MCLTDRPFTILLCETHAMSNDSDGVFTFNVGSVYDNAPELQRYADAPYAYIKLDYFNSNKTDYASTAHTVCCSINNNFPSSLQSVALGSGYNSNLKSSQVFGLIPLNQNNNNKSILKESYVNSLVRIANPFRGDITIKFTLNGLSTPVSMVDTNWLLQLCVYFADDEELYQTNTKMNKPFEGL